LREANRGNTPTSAAGLSAVSTSISGSEGVGWKRIAAKMGVGVGTIYRIALEGSKIREKVI